MLVASLLSFALFASPSFASGNTNSSVHTRERRQAGSDVFSERFVADFSDASAGGDAQTYLSDKGFYLSDWDVPDSPLSYRYTPDNFALGNGEVQLTVSAYSGSGPVIGAEMASLLEFQYGSMRARIRSTTVPGICIGHFFYESDYQETDIELLTSTAFEDSAQVPAGVWFTNQKLNDDASTSNMVVPYGFDPAQAFHEYRIDWLPDHTSFFIDGEERGRITENVPSVVGPYILNGWSNGDPAWSAGPPQQDATFAVESIEILHGYNG